MPHPRPSWSLSLPALALLLVGACHSDRPTTATGGEGTCQQIFALARERLPACQGGDPAAWTAIYSLIGGPLCNEIGAAVAAGRTRIDEQQAAACADLIRGASCATLEPDPSPCDELYVGLVPAGGTCLSFADCAKGTACRVPGNACGGTCVAVRQIGESCDLSGNMNCVSHASCEQGHCVARVHQGQGGPCASDFDCRDGVLSDALYCPEPPDPKAGTCQAVKSAGPCARNEECQARYYCAPDSHTCTLRLAAGARCTPGEDACENTSACAGTTGAAGTTCVSLPRPVGSSCSRRPGEAVLCDGWCDASPSGGTGLCQPKKKDGERCASAAECLGRCDEAAGRCVPACPF
jgi:hypothetical protein